MSACPFWGYHQNFRLSRAECFRGAHNSGRRGESRKMNHFFYGYFTFTVSQVSIWHMSGPQHSTQLKLLWLQLGNKKLGGLVRTFALSSAKGFQSTAGMHRQGWAPPGYIGRAEGDRRGQPQASFHQPCGGSPYLPPPQKRRIWVPTGANLKQTLARFDLHT